MTATETSPRPSTLAVRFVKYLVGFGVWFVIGLAPLLGTKKIPLFSPLIDLYPASVRWWLIPVSGLLMGMIGVVVEFESVSKRSRGALTTAFRGAAITFGIALVTLVLVYRFTVVIVAVTQGDLSTERFAFVTGTLSVPADKAPACDCPAGTSAQICVKGGVSDDAIEACFGPTRIAIASIILALLYLIVTGAFAASAGLLLLSQWRASRDDELTGMRLFITYGRDDVERVSKLAQLLTAGGYTVWFDNHLMPGQNWKKQLGDEIQRCDALVYALTKDSVASEWCQWELATAVRLKKVVVPVLLEDGVPIPPQLETLQYADFRQGQTDIATAKLIGALGLMQKVPEDWPLLVPAEPQGVPSRA
jgi:TIR domain